MITAALALTAPEARAAGTYVALGDSVSAGGGAPPGRGFVELYYAHLGDLDRLAKLAVGGETTSTMSVPGGQLERAVAAIDAPDDTAVLTLGIGGNDARSCTGGVNAPTCPFLANYPAIVGQLAAALERDPGAERFQVLQYYNPYAGTALEDAAAAVLLGSDRRVDCAGVAEAVGFNDAIACLGQAAGATTVDAYPTFALAGQGLMADPLHPNALGHEYLACLFAHPERAGSANPCAPPVPDPAPAPPAPPSPPPAAVPPRDIRAPALSLRRHGRQRVLARGGIVVRVWSDEDAAVQLSGTLTAAGRRLPLRAATTDVRANAPTRVRLRLAARHRRYVRSAKRQLTARITVQATDRAGNTARARRTLRRLR